ncbi:MAG: 2-amino-4-hydroxy-6-hydroxymethyldihydropteridine diphosphokinase [Acidobacteria bacterium]|nr:2-amino-4-hydroxy-6-hydroxymethyldihydropteridine diphosphokinase [Acidobacteriota bacterium]MCZ6769373.1 2-amino-4-hydroxy-6-hydroxymethyldihydropteridine diphosphokinase [Acidobacteriota bacterium]MCZ6878708.1 2-amino-4-hydroxy-6-hydroxymethyldihydropteridine diphosphokinase [Acidobacteriota bacterium]
MMDSSIYLSLGSNLGDRRTNLKSALGKLHEKKILLLDESSIYETEPVEVPEQPEFLNLVCRVQTELKPEALLRACQEIESELGRIRQEIKGARTIDIDILFYGQQILQRPSLKIPHPAWCKRNFVLIPLAEIASDFRDPVTAKTVAQLRRESPDGARVTPQKNVLSPQE